jgi:hypothetical protein
MTVPAPLAHLVDGLRGDIGRLTDRIVAGQISATQWHNGVLRELTDYHTAAYLAGTAQRLGVREGTALLNKGNLSQAERRDIRAQLTKQATYLSRFTDLVEAGDLSPAELRARAASYAGSVKSTYWQARTGADLPFQPSEGCECGPNCQCSWQERDGGWWWQLGHVKTRHCETCLERADGSPY